MLPQIDGGQIASAQCEPLKHETQADEFHDRSMAYPKLKSEYRFFQVEAVYHTGNKCLPD
jgi:hypothetical protein